MTKVKVGLIGVLDMLKFKNMKKNREEVIEKAPANDIPSEFIINKKAKQLHPDKQVLVCEKIIEHPESKAKSFILSSNEVNKPVAFFRAGQYLSLKIQIGDSFVTSPYSISSSPTMARKGQYRITIKETKDGLVSTHMLNNIKEGDTIITSGPEGTFFYDKYRDHKDVIALVGGSGITPFVSMAHAIEEGLENFNLTIIYGSNTSDSILFKDELDAIASNCNKVKVVYVLDKEEKKGFEHGYITAELIKKYASNEYSIYVCGPHDMYNFVSKEIEKLDKPKREVRFELQGLPKDISNNTDYPKEVKDKTFKLTIKQGPIEKVVEAKACEPLLVAIEKSGIKAPAKCKSGVCGWCRSKLLIGSVYIPKENDGRRYTDIEFNYIHPCATYPTGDCTIEIPGEYLD